MGIGDMLQAERDAEDAKRYRYLVRNPKGAQRLFHLLHSGMGNANDLDTMIDGLIVSEAHIRQVNERVRQSNAADTEGK